MEQDIDSEEQNVENDLPTQTGSLIRMREHIVKERRPRFLSALEEALVRFTPGERLALYLLATLLSLSALALVYKIDADVSVVVPAPGGTLVEGETGPARFINPLLATSQADQDLTELVYSGLMRETPDGTLVPDLATSYTISPDGRTYTFKLRQNATFQDGTTVTAADVLYTISMAQDTGINSPQEANWTGVQVSSPDPETVIFTLPKAYAPFLYDTTLGILPAHLWQGTSDEEFPFSPLNTHPVGSGPYKISSVSTDSTGAATRYDLVPFGNYALGTPYLSHLSFVFFSDETSLIAALNAGKIGAASGLDASDISSIKNKNLSVVEVPLPRDFGVFFNQSHNPALADPSVRAALSAAIDKQAIVENSLGGLGASLNGPIPPGVIGGRPTAPSALAAFATTTASTGTDASLAQQARTILQNGGWKFNSSTGTWTKGKEMLRLTIATADQPELVATAHQVAEYWQAAGIQVSVQVYPLAQLNQDVIEPRSYDALLFGEVVGPQLDLYAFWDSSQSNDPGLNLALYANSKTDALLSQARATSDTTARDALYDQFSALLVKDTPAVFLYAPDFVYVVPKDLQGVELGALDTPSDRFANVYQWYVDTQYVWSVFAPSNSATDQ